MANSVDPDEEKKPTRDQFWDRYALLTLVCTWYLSGFTLLGLRSSLRIRRIVCYLDQIQPRHFYAAE